MTHRRHAAYMIYEQDTCDMIGAGAGDGLVLHVGLGWPRSGICEQREDIVKDG